MAQYNPHPAFTGYLTEAQANTIEKMRDKKVWGYWAHEMLVGYQRLGPGPDEVRQCHVHRLLRGDGRLFETLNDHRFSEARALSLRWNDDTEYRYEFNSLARGDRAQHGHQQPGACCARASHG